jgi:hypothetical protein
MEDEEKEYEELNPLRSSFPVNAGLFIFLLSQFCVFIDFYTLQGTSGNYSFIETWFSVAMLADLTGVYLNKRRVEVQHLSLRGCEDGCHKQNIYE